MKKQSGDDKREHCGKTVEVMLDYGSYQFHFLKSGNSYEYSRDRTCSCSMGVWISTDVGSGEYNVTHPG